MFNSNASSAAGDANYIEDVFQTWLYTGTGVAQTITNGVDISGDGGMVWIKGRNQPEPSVVVDTARGASNALRTSSTAAQINDAGRVSAFTSSGFTVGTDGETNGSGTTYASWTFREQPKFFDVVTYTGNGVAGRTVAHDLGSVPGCIIVKQTSASGQDWMVYHRSLATNDYILLNSTGAASTYPYISSPTSTTFTVESAAPVNSNGASYVAYLFAHDAGGFGLTGTDNVISCGSFTTDGSGNATVSLGYEPQWVMVKDTTNVQNWYIEDNMRAFNLTSRAILFPNLSNAEATGTTAYLAPNSTGFAAVNGQLNASATYIYVAIRRGPMKVPTSGTSVFSPITSSASTGTTLTTNFPIDLQILKSREAVDNNYAVDRLRGVNTNGVTGTGGPYLVTNTAAAEVSNTNLAISNGWDNTSFKMPGGFGTLSSVFWSFRRAPGFFDEVCYTGNGGAQTIKHNLNVVPELIIGRNRTGSNWSVNFNFATTTQSYAFLNLTDSGGNLSYAGAGVFSGAPTSTEMYLVNSGSMNGNGQGIVAYLFASCPGVSKIGVYTGTGTTQIINCGFTAGSRFVLIKRTDSTGDWYVWDSARGIIAGNDPYLLLNSSAAEVTGTDYVDTAATGFELSSTAPAALNANGGTYIFLAIA